jgi:CBF1 interacting corepressor
MGGGLAFLTKKSFNPANWTNQKQVWEARQKETIEKRRLAERDAQLKREREEEDLATAIGGEEGGGRKALSFMYDGGKVPGLERRKGGGGNDDRGEGFEGGGSDHQGWQNQGENNEDTTEKKKMEIEQQSLYERQPGDDDAAAAFREMLARGTADEDESTSLFTSETRPDAGGAAEKEKDATTDEMLRGGDNRTNLEKAVGRNRLGVDVTLAQQMERFPMLKGAPRALPPKPACSGVDGDKDAPTDSDVVALNFKPLGQVLRNVRCCKCSEWGHSMGDRECKLTGWDPFSSTPRLPPVAAVATSDAINVVHHESRNASAETLEDERKQKKEKKRHRKDKRKRHARDDERRSRQHKRAKSSKRHRHRRDRSPSYSSSSYSSSGDESFQSRDRRSSKRGEDRYRSRKRQHNRDHHRRRDSDTSSSGDRRHRLSKESGSKRREKSTSQWSRPVRRRSRSRSSSRSSVRLDRCDGISSNDKIDDGGRYYETGATSSNFTLEDEIKEKLLRRKILNKRRRDTNDSR